MPEQVTKEWLERIGLSPNLASRNLHGLRYLGLINEAGYTTETAERLRVAAAEDFPSLLEGVIRNAYEKIFAIRDPSVDSRSRIDDAFRHESPSAQRTRMVACFLGLCAMAGIPLREAPPARDNRNRVGQPRKKGETRLPTATQSGEAAGRAVPPPPAAHVTPGAGKSTSALLLAKFPEFDPAWPDTVKEKWFDAFARLHEELNK